MLLRTLGGLSLEGSSFPRPKPLLLLAYLSIEGPADRERLAKLFWPGHEHPRQNLAVAVSQLKSRAPGALSSDAGRLISLVDCDARRLISATTVHDWRGAVELYRGPFIESIPVNVGEELESWILDTRDYLGGIFGSALVDGALDRLENRKTQKALELAEGAYRIYEAGVEMEPGRLGGLHSVLSYLGSPHAESLRREAEGLGVDLHVSAAPVTPPGHTPGFEPRLPSKPTSPLIGRQRELGELRALVEQGTRLITVTGFSGVGKSRLALEFCHEARERHAFEAVMFVPMEPVSHPEAAHGHLASAVGFRLPQGEPVIWSLARFLDDKRTLLVVDNMEHLTAWASHLEELVSSTERLVVIATSTQPLALQDETLFLLGGLELTSSPEDPQTAHCAAVRYFEDRARRVVTDFSAETVSDEVWRICALVDGLPLGLELAAGLVRVLSLEHLAELLEGRPEHVVAIAENVPERHRSLLRLCEHAWAYLAEGERKLLAALSVFEGSFTIADLEAVSGPVVADLARLERRSLVKRDGDRYSLHPLIKRFAAERLAEDADTELAVRDRHAEHVALAMKRLQTRADVNTEGEVAGSAERALPDVIAAWRWSVERMAEANLVLLLPLMRSTLNARGRNEFANELIKAALDRVDGVSSAAAHLHLALAQQVIERDRMKARQHAKIALAAATSSNDVVAEGLAALTLAATDEPSVGLTGTRPLIRATLRRLREARSWELVASCYRHLALTESSVHRHGALLELGLRCLRRHRLLSLSTALSYYLAIHRTDSCGDHRAALDVAREHLRSELEGPARAFALVDIHSLVAYLSLNAGELDEARRHHDEATKLTARRSEAPDPVYWATEYAWSAWAAPLVALHTEGTESALTQGLERFDLPEARDLLVHVLLSRGDHDHAAAAAERWHEMESTDPVVRYRIFRQAISQRLRATFSTDVESRRRSMAAALRTCARHHLVPLALDFVVSSYHLFPDLVHEDEAFEAATHPSAYHSTPLFLTNFRGPSPSKVDQPPYSAEEVLRKSAALADRLESRGENRSRSARPSRNALNEA